MQNGPIVLAHFDSLDVQNFVPSTVPCLKWYESTNLDDLASFSLS